MLHIMDLHAFDDFDESITDVYMPELKEFVFNNNEIDDQVIFKQQ